MDKYLSHIFAWSLLIGALTYTFLTTNNQQLIPKTSEDLVEDTGPIIIEKENSVSVTSELITENNVDAIEPTKEVLDKVNYSNDSSKEILEPEPVITENNNEIRGVLSSDLLEKEINLQSIVLVRCIFRSQFYEVSSQPWGEEVYTVGSGIIISPNGTILTARHVTEISEEFLNDPAGRIWERVKCDTALTDEELSEITSIGSWGQEIDPAFKDVEIIFIPDDDKYDNANGFDFALLKLESNKNFSYTSLFPYLIRLEPKEDLILIGYPGRESASPQKLERFDGEFQSITYYSEKLCNGEIKPCGLRYAFRRYPYDYKSYFWKSTELGIITPYFRGGFSGGPTFYKGNLIGIVTHGISGNESESGWDQAIVLTSWDILEFLKVFSDVILSEN